MSTMDEILDKELSYLDANNTRRHLVERGRKGTPLTEVDGTTYVSFGSNDYLGLSQHPDVLAAAVQATHEWGTGATGSRLTSGNYALLAKLERKLAEFKGTEDCVVFCSGYAANIGTIPALAGPDDLILSDSLNHASLIDACKLSKATVRVYAHANAEFAAALLQDRAEFRRLLIITDGVFSMDGDLAPLTDLAAICEQHDGWLVVDDAHGTGVVGPQGRGTAASLGCTESVHVHVGTLSKALGSAGGFVAGSHNLCETLRNRARSFVFATAPVPSSVGAAIKALEVLQSDPDLLAGLWQNIEALKERMGSYTVAALPSQSAVQAVVIGSSSRALESSARLRDRGLWIPAIRPPTVPLGTARLRICPTAAHTAEQIAVCASAVAELALVGMLAEDKDD